MGNETLPFSPPFRSSRTTGPISWSFGHKYRGLQTAYRCFSRSVNTLSTTVRGGSYRDPASRGQPPARSALIGSRGLAHHRATLAHLCYRTLGSGGQKGVIGQQGHELKAKPDHLFCHRGRPAVNSRMDAMALCACHDGLDSAYDDRVCRHAGGSAAKRDRQIVRADVDRVETRDAQDVVEILDRLPGLDHRHCDHRIVGVFEVIRSPKPG